MSVFILLTVVLGLKAADCPYDITWYRGTTFSGKIPVTGPAKSLTAVYGMFPDGTEIKVPSNKKITLTGPGIPNGTKQVNLAQPAITAYDESTDTYVSTPQPGITINFQYSPSSYKAAGEYTATIPAGSFTIDGVDNVEFTASFMVGDESVYTPTDLVVTPSPLEGVDLTSIDALGLTVDNKDYVEDTRLYSPEGVNESLKVSVLKPDGTTDQFALKGVASSTYTLRYEVQGLGQYTDPGEYTVTYPEGIIKLSGYSDASKLYTNKQLAYTYTIADATAEPEITWYYGTSFSGKAPVNGPIRSLTAVYGMYPAGTQIYVPENKKITLAGPGIAGGTKEVNLAQPTVTTYNESTGGYDAVLQPGITINFNFYPSSYKAEGDYTANIPAGSFTINGKENAEMNLTFTVADTRVFTPADLTVTPTPLESDVLTYIDALGLAVDNKDYAQDTRLYTSEGVNEALKVSVRKPDGTTDELALKGVAGSTYTLKYEVQGIEQYLDAGQYTVTYPEGIIKLSGYEDSSKLYTNKALSYTYTISGGSSTPVEDEIRWCYGSSWGNKIPFNGQPVPSLSTVWGVLDDKTVSVKANSTATLAGPGGFTNDAVRISQAKVYDAIAQAVVDAPGFGVYLTEAPAKLETPGDYVLSIPADVFTVNGVSNKAFTATFTIKDTRVFEPIDFDVKVYPAPGTDIPTLENIYMNFDLNDSEDTRIYTALGLNPDAKATLDVRGESVREFELMTVGSTPGTYRVGLKGDYGYAETGTYVLTLPEGAVRFSDNDGGNKLYTNKKLVYTFYVNEPVEPELHLVITPSDKDVQALGGVEIEVVEGYKMEVADGSLFSLQLPDGTTRTLDQSLSLNKYYLKLFSGNEVFVTPGNYTLRIPNGALKFMDDNDNVVPCTKDFSMTYTVSGGTFGDLAYTVKDDEGEISLTEENYTYSLKQFYVTFDEDITATAQTFAIVKYPDGSQKYVTVTYSTANKRFLVFLNFPSAKGLYEITFPAGAACKDGVFNKAATWKINYIDHETGELNCTSNPENGSDVTELLNLSLTASSEDYTSLRRYLGGITPTYFTNDDDPDNREMQYLKESGDPLTLSITLDAAVKEVGDYTWTIPANSIVANTKDGKQVLNNELRFFWSIRNTGLVDGICDDDESVNVFDINGVQLVRNGNRSELDKLAAGIYIINGKKVILK